MKILLVTPLYPPDIAGPAPYVKELAKRLSGIHEVTTLAYNHIPEKIDGVTIVTIEKSVNVLQRLFRFYRELGRLAPQHDILYIQNGPSVELPVLTYLLTTTKRPMAVLRLGDTVPLIKSARSFESRVTRTLMNRVAITLSHDDTSKLTLLPTTIIPRPLSRPEMLPFREHDEKEFNVYEASWNEHVARLEKLFAS